MGKANNQNAGRIRGDGLHQPRQERGNHQARKILKLLDKVLDKTDTQKVRSEFAISWQWKVLAEIKFDEATKEARIAWVHEVANEADIKTDDIEKLVGEQLDRRRRG